MKNLILLFAILLNSAYVQAVAPLSSDFDMVTLVIAQATSKKIESRFGHAFLRFSKNEEYNSLHDTAVEFAALIENGKTSVLRGAGIGKGYTFEMRPTPFQYLLIDHTQNQDRNLTHYRLNLSKDEIAELINMINDYIIHGNNKTYNFFYRNCSSVISEVLGNAVDQSISGFGKNVPSKLPVKLKEKGLIVDEFLVPSLKTQREEIINKNLDSTLHGINHYYLQNLASQLKGSPNKRMIGYLKLLNLESELKLGTRLSTFAKRLIVQESPRIKLDLMRLANGKYKGMFQFIEFSEFDKGRILDSQMIHAISSDQAKTKFIKKKGKAFLQLEVNGICDSGERTRCHKEIFQFDHPNLFISQKNENVIELNGVPVTYLGKVKSIKQSLNAKVGIFPEVVKINGKPALKVFIVQDFFSKDQSVSMKGIHILNSKNKQNPLGQCAGLTYLQKKLMENVFFRPEEGKRSSTYYTEVIYSALAGKQVFAFGVSSIEELTTGADQESLQKLISQTNSKHNELFKLSVDWIKRKKIDKKSIDDIAYFAERGLYTSLVFRPSEKVKVEHMLLIYGVKEEKDHYKLLVYDSNLGLVPENYSIEYRLNKRDLSLSSNLYKSMANGHTPFIQ